METIFCILLYCMKDTALINDTGPQTGNWKRAIHIHVDGFCFTQNTKCILHTSNIVTKSMSLSKPMRSNPSFNAGWYLHQEEYIPITSMTILYVYSLLFHILCGIGKYAFGNKPLYNIPLSVKRVIEIISRKSANSVVVLLISTQWLSHMRIQ